MGVVGWSVGWHTTTVAAEGDGRHDTAVIPVIASIHVMISHLTWAFTTDWSRRLNSGVDGSNANQ